MKCDECNGTVKSITGAFLSKSKALGKISIPNITYTKCGTCGVTWLNPEMAEKVTTFKKQKQSEMLLQLPVGDFITLNEASKILGVTKQAFSKNNKIKRGFIFFVEIDNKKLFHKQSVEQFKSKGDGRFVLSKHYKVSLKSTPTSHHTSTSSLKRSSKQNQFTDRDTVEV